MKRSTLAVSSRRVFGITLATVAAFLLGHADAIAASPLDEHGLVRPDGRLATAPPAPVWGARLVPAVRSKLEARARTLRAELGRVWISWDAVRGVPREIITAGVPAPGAVRSPVVARLFAELWLARHLELLAPGSSLGDFELVSNELSAGIRSVGFRQLRDGVPVVGGQLSLLFAGDSLIHVGSQALPNVTPATSGPVVAEARARAHARAWIEADYPAATVRSPAGSERVLLPLFSGQQLSYHDVVRVEVRADAPAAGHWAVYLDAHTGEPVAREQLLTSVGTLRFNVPTRHPLSTREDALVPELAIVQAGNPAITNLQGQFGLSANPATVSTSVAGPRISVDNVAGAEASTNFQVSEGGTAVWNAANNEFVDAQLSAFVHASRAKAYVRAIDPELTWLDEILPIQVNINNNCNAFADEQGIHFFRESGQCANTARLADVVAHEFGHRVHMESLIMGVGAFDSALSEGVSDYLASTMANDSGMGRGFFKNNQPLRELDPNGSEPTWPDDISVDPHETGRIIGGALWDLREELIAQYGNNAGLAHADELYYQAHRRAVDIPAMYAQVVIADDDDADLSNGSPNICMINQVFAAHGLFEIDSISSVEIEHAYLAQGLEISLIANTPMLADCPESLDSATLRWRLRDDPNTVNELAMTLVQGAWVATIPKQAAGVVVEYQVDGVYMSGTELTRPLNGADPWYQAYFGAVEPIYCLDPQADLGAWTFGGVGNLWSFGPLDAFGPADPSMPYDDDGVQLSMDGQYQPDSNSRATSPLIDIAGHDDVRLHYYRWLSVEDGFYDQASISANGQELWSNLATMGGQTQHLDGEWRFHDLELAEFIADGDVELEFKLVSDQGLEFGGWTIDALCVVEVTEAVCGDGQIDGAEQCDDGNTVDGDGCDGLCQLEEPVGTDSGTDSSDTDTSTGTGTGTGTTGDDAGDDVGSDSAGSDDVGTDSVSADDGISDEGCNCSTSGDQPRPWSPMWLLALAGLGLVRRPRREHRQRARQAGHGLR